MRSLFSNNWLKAVGGIAQLVERLHGMQEVSGSIPLTSTNIDYRFNDLSHIALWVFLLNLRWCQIEKSFQHTDASAQCLNGHTFAPSFHLTSLLILEAAERVSPESHG
jgi:hypothetical protein